MWLGAVKEKKVLPSIYELVTVIHWLLDFPLFQQARSYKCQRRGTDPSEEGISLRPVNPSQLHTTSYIQSHALCASELLIIQSIISAYSLSENQDLGEVFLSCVSPGRAQHNCVNTLTHSSSTSRLTQQHPGDQLALNPKYLIHDTKWPLEKDFYENRVFSIHLPTPAKLVKKLLRGFICTCQLCTQCSIACTY